MENEMANNDNQNHNEMENKGQDDFIVIRNILG